MAWGEWEQLKADALARRQNGMRLDSAAGAGVQWLADRLRAEGRPRGMGVAGQEPEGAPGAGQGGTSSRFTEMLPSVERTCSPAPGSWMSSSTRPTS